jgi:ABC-type sugar transport system substrate-binding protein
VRKRNLTYLAGSVVAVIAFVFGNTALAGGSSSVSSAALKLEKIPTKILVTTPLTKKAPHERAVLVGPLTPAGVPLVDGFKDAMQALGWSYGVYQYQSTGSPAESLQQALLSNPNYIYDDATLPDLMTQGIAEAEQKHIPIIGSNIIATGTAFATYKYYYPTVASAFLKAQGVLTAEWDVAAHPKPINAVIINDPSLGAIVNDTADGMAQVLSACSGCTHSTLNVTTTQWAAGDDPEIVTAYMQSHPSTNVALYVFGDLDTGVPSALTTAGSVKKVWMTGSTADFPQLKNIVSGVNAPGGDVAFTADPLNYGSWLAADTMARLSIGQKLPPPSQEGFYPSFVYTVRNAAPYTSAVWNGPAGYEAAFKKLWHVG